MLFGGTICEGAALPSSAAALPAAAPPPSLHAAITPMTPSGALAMNRRRVVTSRRHRARDGQLEAVRIGELECHRPPGQRRRASVELQPGGGRAGGERRDVLRGIEPDAQADTLHAVLPSREVVLAEPDPCGAGP